jgi:5-methylcytosine-specific restriction enzyme A
LLTRYGRGETGAVYYPIAALHGAGLWELGTEPESVPSAHGSSVPRRWFDEHQPNGGLVKPVYDMVRDSTEVRAAAVAALVDTYFTDTDATGAFAALTDGQRRSLAQEYQRLCGRADVHWQNLDDKRATRISSVPVRYEDARTAVMLRSQGRCENPRRTGDIRDLTDAGDPPKPDDGTMSSTSPDERTRGRRPYVTPSHA